MWKSRRNKIIEDVKIVKIGYGWVGIGILPDGKKAIVKGWALPNSIVDIRVTRNKKDYVQWHILKIKKSDPDYSNGEIFCPHYFTLTDSKKNVSPGERQEAHKIWCGWCKWQVMSYEKQLELKEKIVLENYQRILKDSNTKVFPIIWSRLDKGYRNKIEFSFGKYLKRMSLFEEEKKEKKSKDQKINKDAEIKKRDIEAHRNLGFHKQWEFSKIVDIESCGLISQKANKVFAYIKNMAKDSWLPVHDQMRHEWLFRHLAMREGINTGQLLVNLVIADKALNTSDKIQQREGLKWKMLKDPFLHETITSFVITKNNGLADIVRWQDISLETLRWDGYIFEKLQFNVDQLEGGPIKMDSSNICKTRFDSESTQYDSISESDKKNPQEWTFRVSPFSFFQTNTKGAEQLFSRSAEMLGKVKWTILDLYCGTGTIGLSFLLQGIWNELIGIEIVEEAIDDAWKNAEINKLKDKSYFVAWAAEKVLLQNTDLESQLKNLALVILDPPREGLHKDVVKFLLDLKKEHQFKLLYISCNPVTMARDVQLLIEGGMSLKSLQAVDMFPQTHHIECIGILG